MVDFHHRQHRKEITFVNIGGDDDDEVEEVVDIDDLDDGGDNIFATD